MAQETAFLHIDPRDNVAVALRKVSAGETVRVNDREYTIDQDIPVAHKMALEKIPAGQKVIKYSYPIGYATTDILPGHWIHSHNLRTALGGLNEYKYQPDTSAVTPSMSTDLTFNGYVREDGKVGIRNEVWVINTVGCCNVVADDLCKVAAYRFKHRGFAGVTQFSHPQGCSQMENDLKHTQKILASLVHHPNAGGVLVLGLGCENNNIEEFKEVIGPYNPDRVKFLNLQEVEDDISEGVKLLDELITYLEPAERKPVPLFKLKIGLKCGGSDAFSGVTANPLVGRLSDRLIAAGGTSILTEVPEMFGAETVLMARSMSEDVFQKVVDLINDFKKYFMRYDQVIYENPSPGNKEGGITTLEEKSLGAVLKGGRGTVVDVLHYGDRASRPGLNLLSGPGNDIVAVTSLAAAGAQMVIFTTGRGTPLGGPVPTVKVATNSTLTNRKPQWIDFNAGKLLEGVSMDELTDEFLQEIITLASGKRTKNEVNDYRQIAIFKDGVTL